MSLFFSWGRLALVGGLLAASCRAKAPSTARDLVEHVTSALLPGAWASADVGQPGRAGSDSYDPATGMFTITGSGTGIPNRGQSGDLVHPWNDQFHFVYLHLPVVGDFELAVRVATMGPPVSQAGIAVRADLTSAPLGVTLFHSPSSSNASPPKDMVEGAIRTIAGTGQTFSQARFDFMMPTPAASPVWLKIVRISNDIGTYWSRDGADWIPIATGGSLSMTDAYLGLYVASSSE